MQVADRAAFGIFQFHTTLSTPFFWNESRTGIMETYWCTQKHSIIDMMNGKEIPLALSPCIKSECEMWREGECSHIRKVGKPDRPQVFSKEG